MSRGPSVPMCLAQKIIPFREVKLMAVSAVLQFYTFSILARKMKPSIFIEQNRIFNS